MSAKLERTATPGIYKRGRSYVVVFRDPQGRQRKRFARTLGEARDLKAALTADVRRGEYRTLAKVTFADYAAEWVETYTGRTARGIRDVTRADYRKRIEQDAIPFFGRMHLAAIEPRDIKLFTAHVASRGLAANTVRLALAPVRALLATAFEDGLIRSNPAAGVRLASSNGSEESEPEHVKALAEDELARLLEQLPASWRLFFELLAHTGMRIGEASALRWQDVDLVHRRVLVRRRFYRGGFAPPKSRYGRRDIPLTERLARDLGQRAVAVDDDEDALVFPSERGTVLDASNLMARVLKPAAANAGLGEWVVRKGKRAAESWVGFHTFRHTCATILFRAGLNAKQVQMWLGHHSPAFTLATYVHLLPDDLPDVAVLDRHADGNEGNAGATSPDETSGNVAPLAAVRSLHIADEPLPRAHSG